MTAAVVELVSLPVLAWVAVGVGLLVAYRRSTSAVVFRLAAVFLAFWAVFATTGLAWIVSAGGWSAVVRLAAAPDLIFGPTFARLWLFGLLGALGIFATAFLLSQIVGRGYLALHRPRPMAWPSTIPPPATATALLSYDSPRPDAFSFTLLELRPNGGVRRRDVILFSEGLLQRLTPAERDAVIAHELGHIRELDGRYLTFFRTLSRLMRWDPILAYLANRLTEREELRADSDAVELTRRPRALARALFKAAAASDLAGRAAPGLLGTGGRRGRLQTAERIRRLVALAESGRFPEDLVE
ncbi:MAG TPA: M48 family metalloprotease [Thermoplasmata archaeon]|nr:M48 family metalloprotease [Thermoplasmata archaeon]